MVRYRKGPADATTAAQPPTPGRAGTTEWETVGESYGADSGEWTEPAPRRRHAGLLEPRLSPGLHVDHFQVIRRIGRGGMGEVYLARDTQLGRKVALKLLHPKVLRDEEATQRFLFEARTTARFNHPHIVTIHAVGEYMDSPYVALEYLQGQTLKERIIEAPPRGREILRIGLAVAEALKEAHAHGVLHRDLKPGNVMIPRDGRLRVLDFGLAKRAEAVRAPGASMGGRSVSDAPDTLDELFETGENEVRGTPAYMAPEQWGGQEIDAAADVWALGMILYQLVNGQHPYADEMGPSLGVLVVSREPVPPLPVNLEVDPELEALIEACLSKLPVKRPTAAEVAAILDNLLDTSGSMRKREREREPFRGLLPCDERDANWFFGRATELDAFLERTRNEAVLPVVGPSGAGKSSFVAAGVVPRLREEENWTVLRMRPGRRPMRALIACLLRGDARTHGKTAGTGTVDQTASHGTGLGLEALEGVEKFLHEELREAPGKLGLRLARTAEQNHSKVLLFVDQLEELYTQGTDEEQRKLFMRALCAAADDPEGPIRVVFTLRDDFLGRVAETEEAREALSRVTVMRSPGPASLEEILVCSAISAGYAFDDPTLVAEIVRDVQEEAAALPLLQVTGQLLWQRRDQTRQHLRREDYETMGGVAGALADHADGVLVGLSDTQIQIVRTLLLRLVTPEGTRRVVPRPAALDDLPDEAADVLDRLVEGRLLLSRKPRRGRGDAELEIVHESLIRSWGRLSRWIEESREERSFVEEATQAAALWDRRGRPEQELWSGGALSIALSRLDQIQVIPEVVFQFVEAARARRDAERRRRRNGLIALFAALAAVASVFAWLAYEASHQRTLSELRQAEVLLEGARSAYQRGDLLQARALSRESLERADSLAARSMWLNVSEDPEIWAVDFRDQVFDLGFSPDGRTLAAVIGDQPLAVIDTTTASARVLEHTEGPFRSVLYPTGGETLLAGGQRSITVFDLQGGNLAELPGSLGFGLVNSIAVSPDGATVAWSNELASRYEITRIADGESLGIPPFEAPTSAYPVIVYSPDGRYLVFVHGERVAPTVQVWDVQEQRLLEAVPCAAPSRVHALAVSRGTPRLAVADSTGTIRLWDLTTQTPIGDLIGHRGSVYAVDFSPDGAILASGGADGTVRLWDTGDGRELAVGKLGANVSALRFQPDGRRLALGSDDGTVRLWDVATLQALRSPRGAEDKVHILAAFDDGETVAAAGDGGVVRLFDATSGREVHAFSGPRGIVHSLSVCPDQQHLITSGRKEPVTQWDVATQNMVRVHSMQPYPFFNQEFSPDGRYLSIGEQDGVVIHEFPSGVLVADLPHPDVPFSQQFSRDGNWLVTSSRDRLLRVWEVPSGRLAHVLSYEKPLSFPSISADGSVVIADSWIDADPDVGTLHTWDLRDGTSSRAELPDGRSCSVVFHPDGIRIGLQCVDGTAHVWNPSTGEVVTLDTTAGLDNYGCFRFGPYGDWAWVMPPDETVRLFDVENGRPLWRAPALVRDPHEVLTHQGWQAMDATRPPRSDRGAGWQGLLEADARFAAHSADGNTLCVDGYTTGVALWDTTLDERLAGEAGLRARDLVALDGRCVILDDDGAVSILERNGNRWSLAEDATAISADDGEILVAFGHAVSAYTLDGTQRETITFDGRLVALTRIDNLVLAGTEHGRIGVGNAGPPPDSAPDDPRSEGSVPVRATLAGGHPFSFEDLTSKPVTRVVEGPNHTVVAGFRNGFVGVWDMQTGALLHRLKLHGPVVHLVRDGASFHAATEVGDFATLDLGVLQRDHCSVLSEVWSEAPLVWRGGRAVAEPPDPGHPCAQ